MDQEELMNELDALVDAMEQSLTILTGTLAEATGPALTLQRLLQGQKSMAQLHGPSGWRDRLLGSSLKLAAIMAMANLNRAVAQGEPDDLAQRVLIDQVLQGRLDKHF
ncbi:MAG: hypothetical protein RBS40_16755 [Rhodocyclaceae bacterium]|jgi:hypothetical protein|nr:hypothetical protein [Rhodocyclaceae bacterium]